MIELREVSCLAHMFLTLTYSKLLWCIGKLLLSVNIGESYRNYFLMNREYAKNEGGNFKTASVPQ